jgi:TolB protein
LSERLSGSFQIITLFVLIFSPLTVADQPLTRHTTDGRDKIRPVWAPDGRVLMFSRALPDTSSYLHVVLDTAAADSPERQLTDRKETEYHGVISPDGSKVLLTVIPRSGTQGDCDLAIVPFSGGKPETIVANREGKLSHQEWPAWSPDGQLFAFVSTHEGNQEIYRAKIDGTDMVRLTQSQGIDTHPCYTPDGSRIVFATDRFGGLELASMKADGTDIVRLTTSPGIDDFPCVSPDGGHIAFTTHRDGQFEVYVIDSDGSNPVNLSNSLGRDTQPSWSPDGQGVTFVSDRGGQTDLYSVGMPSVSKATH